jgi:protein TonB
MRRFPDTSLSLLALILSALLHAGFFMVWLQHEPATTGAPAAQEITVDLFSADTIPADIIPAPTPRPAPSQPPAEIPATEAIPALKPQPAAKITHKPSPQPVALPMSHAVTADQPPADTRAAPQPTLVPARHDANYLHNPHPEYPSISRRMNEEGRVLLRVEVSAEGLPTQIGIKESSGFPRLDESARKTVMRWKFIPATRGEEPFASSVDVPIQFSLQK